MCPCGEDCLNAGGRLYGYLMIIYVGRHQEERIRLGGTVRSVILMKRFKGNAKVADLEEASLDCLMKFL